MSQAFENQAFEKHRAILTDGPNPRPYQVKGYHLLERAMVEQMIAPQEYVLIAIIGDHVVALPMLEMVYHHVAQGQLEGIAWMATYCCLCNGGSVFDACHDGTIYTFAAQGYYDVMVVIADQQTNSYWNHLTGLCLFGDLGGTALTRLGALSQMQAKDALSAYPHAKFTLAEGMSAEEHETAKRWNEVYHLPAQPTFNEGLLATGNKEDTRLPRYDMGLGLWTPHTQRYYPITRLYSEQNIIVDQVDGRQVIIVLNEAVGLPFAFYHESRTVELRDEQVILDHETFYQSNVIYTNGQKSKPDYPHHVAIRWYGFSSIFPNCQIYNGIR